MINDPIGDMLTRIRNASIIRKPEVVIPYSRVKHQIALLLSQAGYVGKVTKIESEEEGNKTKFPQIRIGLRYSDNKPVIHSLKRVSKPGLRIYRGKDQLPVVLNNLGIAIVSTSHGIMTNVDARKKGVGGEVICEVY